jgi:hypothetical protein
VDICFQSCTLETARQVVGPYIRDRLRCDPRSKARLGVSALSAVVVRLRASVMECLYRTRDQGLPYATFVITLPQYTSQEERDKLCIDIVALLPREHMAYLEINLSTSVIEELLVTSPNIEALCLVSAVVSDQFLLPRPCEPDAPKKLLPSLRYLHLLNVEAVDGDWAPLVRYLTHQTSGYQPVPLSVLGQGAHICLGASREIKDLVDSFTYYPDPDEECPFGHCPDYE